MTHQNETIYSTGIASSYQSQQRLRAQPGQPGELDELGRALLAQLVSYNFV